MTTLLEVQSLSARYRSIEALHEVGLHVNEGELVAVIGPNGAGKTTLLRAVARMIGTRQAALRFGGHNLVGRRTEHLLGLGMTVVPEGRALFRTMSVDENLKIAASATRRAGREPLPHSELTELFPVLRDRRDQRAGLLSGGEQQMLAIAKALITRPLLLMLDEPSLGLAPKLVGEVFQTISDSRQLGLSVLLVEQNARTAIAISDRTYVLEQGSVTVEGQSQELLDDPRIRSSYLGEDA